MRKKRTSKKLCLLLCFVMIFSSCNPKTSSTKSISKATQSESSCEKDLNESLEEGNVEHDNVDTLDLLGSSFSGATLGLGDDGSFSLADSDEEEGAYYEMISYAINPLEEVKEDFYRIKLCDGNNQCQCYSDLCKGDYKSCRQFSSCQAPTNEEVDDKKFWLKVTKAVDSIPPRGLSGEVSLSVKYCAYNYYKATDYTGDGGSSNRVEVCGPALASENKVALEKLASDSASVLARKRLDVLASLRGKKQAECTALVEQFGAKAASVWFENKSLCSSKRKKSNAEASACVILEAIANQSSEFTDLLCGEGHFDNLSLLLALNAATASDASSSSDFALADKEAGIFGLVDENSVNEAACKQAESASSFSSDSSSSVDAAADAFANFWGGTDYSGSSYGDEFDWGDEGDGLEFSDFVVEEIGEPLSEESSYSNEEVDNPPIFDEELAASLEDGNALVEGMSKEQKMALFTVCSVVFGVLALHTVIDLVKTLRPKETLSKADFTKLSSGVNVGDELAKLKKIVGDESYKSFFGTEVDKKKYSLKESEGSGFKKIKKDGLFGERIKLSAVFKSDELLKPSFVKGSDGKFYAELKIGEELGKKFEFDAKAAGFELDEETGRYRKSLDQADLNDLGEGKYSIKSSKFDEIKSQVDVNVNVKDKTINFDVTAKTKVNILSGIGTGVKFAAMAGALAGMIYLGSDGAFGLSSEEEESPVKNFLDGLFGEFFLTKLVPVSSEIHCYGQSMNAILENKSEDYWSDLEFTECVLGDMKDRQDYLLGLFQ